MSMPDLALVPLDALKEELLSRCDHGVIALMQCGAGGPDTIIRMRYWRGNPETCIGMATGAIATILADLRQREQEAM